MLQMNEVDKKVYTGAQIFLKSLEKEGVEHIFGIPGGIILPIYDAFHQSTVKHILTKHEQAAVHAAEGYAKSTGKVGVALATSGPGATNTVTGLTDAYYDSVPIVVFTGNVATSILGNDAFQESDIVSITRACTKHNYLVRDVKDLAATVKEAFYVAASGRPGPVLVDLPKDVIMASCEFNYPESINLRGYKPYPEVNEQLVQRCIEELVVAKKPVILCGGGVVSSNSHQELTLFSKKFDIPVASTLMGLGGFPAAHKNFLGFSGMHGNYWANLAISNSDLLVIVGSRLSDRQTGVVKEYCPEAKIIHIDIDPTSLNKNVDVDFDIQGDIKQVLSMFLKNSESVNLSDSKKEERELWWRQIAETKCESVNIKNNNTADAMTPGEVIGKVYELAKSDAIFTTEVGQHQMWAAQLFNSDNPRSFLTSGGLGTMGFGFPAALGAQMANPGRQVIVFAGDGSIQMNIQELVTAVTYDLPVKIVIVNNGYLGMVRQWQGFMFNRYSQSKIFSPDYITLAKAYGANGFVIDKSEDLENTLKDALACPGVAIIDCRVNEEEDVYPWVPVGKANRDMLTEAK
ncbi:MAG: biosynthetic-type acetolactate synthase large subunit [Candidatus Gastranaerophilales bacterium]|nr:biosynthetic-type acetolactate synthase large subunit [Candidatus Gastranaerophilales bacterium]